MPPRRRHRRARPRVRLARNAWVLPLAFAVLVAIGFSIYNWYSPPPPPPAPAGTPEAAPDPRETSLPAGTTEPGPGVPQPEAAEGARESAAPPGDLPAPPPGEGARIALVIDDLGRSLGDLTRLEALGVPVTYSVLPFEIKTPQVVEALRRRGREILCHLPMEAVNGANPGPGALTLGMSREELVTATQKALAAVPGAVGVNNHMGSSFMAQRRAMAPVLQEIARQGLFFLDSRTSSGSVGYRLAVEIGMPATERQVFLDADLDPEAIRRQFHELLQVARTRGAAVAIGHPHPSTLDVLGEEVPRARELGYEFVPVSYLLDSAGGPAV